MKLDWTSNISDSSKESKIFESFDVSLYKDKEHEYAMLEPIEKGQYNGVEQYYECKTQDNISKLKRNYIKMFEEVNERLNTESSLQILPIGLYMQTTSIQDLLTSFENIEYIKAIYKKKKINVKNGLNASESQNLLECIRQGRSLLLAGNQADMIAKPLIYFYAGCAYAYAIIVINSPLKKSISNLKGSHGHTYNHNSEMVDFGGDIPTGTFIDLLCALSNMQICSCRGDIHIKYSLLPSIEMIQEKNISLSLPTLLSMVPELRDSYSFFDDEHQMINKLNIDMGTNNAKTYYNFYIGDGLHRPNRDEIKKAFNTDDVTEQQGSYIVKVPADSISKIMPTVYQDTEGELWYIESPISGMVLPELCLHFLIISALCNIMRYSPHEWSNILSNHDSSEFSLLIRKYLRLFEIKFPMLVTEQISNFKPIIKSDLLK